MLTITVTELRRHTGRYLRRVRASEWMLVTLRGEPVALLKPPLPAFLDQDANAKPHRGDLNDEPPASSFPQPRPASSIVQSYEGSLSKRLLDAEREERWWMGTSNE